MTPEVFQVAADVKIDEACDRYSQRISKYVSVMQ
jgi:hypothetical protein